MSLLEKEWHYLTDEARAQITWLMIAGIKDIETATEMAIVILGDERAFNFEDIS
jgi:hypothetical protein